MFLSPEGEQGSYGYSRSGVLKREPSPHTALEQPSNALSNYHVVSEITISKYTHSLPVRCISKVFLQHHSQHGLLHTSAVIYSRNCLFYSILTSLYYALTDVCTLSEDCVR